MDGTSGAEFSVGFKYYVCSYSNANTPPVYELRSADGKLIKVLEDNADLKTKIKEKKIKAGVYGTAKYDIELVNDLHILNPIFISKCTFFQSKL